MSWRTKYLYQENFWLCIKQKRPTTTQGVMGKVHYSLGRLLLTRGQYRVGSLQFKGLIFSKQQEGQTKAIFYFYQLEELLPFVGGQLSITKLSFFGLARELTRIRMKSTSAEIKQTKTLMNSLCSKPNIKSSIKTCLNNGNGNQWNVMVK